MSNIVKIFPTPQEVAETLASDLVDLIKESEKRNSIFTIALSGGNTPKPLYSILAEKFSRSVDWTNVHFFWVDERCVPPESTESNYRLAEENLFSKIEVFPMNIHRIRGEDNPEKEAERYSEELNDFTFKRGGLPFFNAILLGLGEDGHTASIFPGSQHLFRSDKICIATIHPGTGQQRITISGRVINNAASIVFHVTGKNKADIVTKIVDNSDPGKQYPASLVSPSDGKLYWYLDNEAGMQLKSR
jgi:6-phosphogluconolactonase